MVFFLFKSLMTIPSIGALSATSFSSSKVFAFFAIKVEFLGINKISIYGSSRFSSKVSAILFETTEL